MTDQVFIKHLGSSVQSWLNYISAVGRGFVLGESSVKLPLAEFIGTNIADTNAVKLEHPHPNFLQKRLDLYFKRESNKVEYQTAFEFKYIKDASTLDLSEKKRVFSDLMRLYFFIKDAKVPTKGYFLICGSQYEFNQSFQKISTPIISIVPRLNIPVNIPHKSGFYTKWFKFSNQYPIQSIDLNINDVEYQNIYIDFISKYKNPYFKKMKIKLIMPKKIKTKLVFLSQDNILKDVPEPMKLGFGRY